jgi:hypothetical protein
MPNACLPALCLRLPACLLVAPTAAAAAAGEVVKMAGEAWRGEGGYIRVTILLLSLRCSQVSPIC